MPRASVRAITGNSLGKNSNELADLCFQLCLVNQFAVGCKMCGVAMDL